MAASEPAPFSHVRELAPESDRRLRAIVEDQWEFVGRFLRNCGVPEADLDDALQEVFLVIAAKLDAVRLGSERAFLVQIALRVAARVRRALGRSREVLDDGSTDPADPTHSPEDLIDRNRALKSFDEVLSSMTLELRSVFVLYEVEGFTMAEIAVLADIPPGTVASRLRRAREEFTRRTRMLKSQAQQE